MSKTFMAKKELTQPNWYVVDADNQIVGRLATKIATVLMGKHKPEYTPHVLTGDCIVVINAEKIRFSGKKLSRDESPYFTTKMANKGYSRYTGWPGGHRTDTAADLLTRKPAFILREAVRRMLPKNKLASKMLKNLRLFVGTNHPHQAQQPQELPGFLK